MKCKYATATIFGLAAIIGWNVFLVHRDNELFRMIETRSEKVCAEVKSFHPDCQR